MYKAVLDDRLLAEPGDLEGALADRGLSPHPALLLVLEGETEMLLMPRVLDRPGDLGGSDPWKDAEPCLHSGSTPMSCANAR
jgi:hypothetical protein